MQSILDPIEYRKKEGFKIKDIFDEDVKESVTLKQFRQFNESLKLFCDEIGKQAPAIIKAIKELKMKIDEQRSDMDAILPLVQENKEFND